jgi:hypothetical protein
VVVCAVFVRIVAVCAIWGGIYLGVVVSLGLLLLACCGVNQSTRLLGLAGNCFWKGQLGVAFGSSGIFPVRITIAIHVLACCA